MILNHAITSQRRKIDLAFVSPLLEDDTESIFSNEEEDDLSNPDR